MAFPEFTMRELLEAGVHYGHKTKRWNPRMNPYLYGVRNGIHIIDLQQTVPLLHQALLAIRDTVARNGRILFVGTKRQSAEIIAESAKRCGQYYINQRWLGGLLTNWNTIQSSIKKLRKIEDQLSQQISGLTKREILSLNRQRDKLERSLGGIKEMGGQPDLLFVIDTNKEDLAIQEAKVLGIPIVAIVDSNSSPDGITHPIPGNDDASRAIHLYCRLVADAVLDGIQASLRSSHVDIGESEDVEGLMQEGLDAAATEGREEESQSAGKRRGGGKKNAERPQERKTPTVTVKKTVASTKKTATQ